MHGGYSMLLLLPTLNYLITPAQGFSLHHPGSPLHAATPIVKPKSLSTSWHPSRHAPLRKKLSRTYLKASSSTTDPPTARIDQDEALDKSLQALDLSSTARLLRDRDTSLSRSQWGRIFDAIEERTAQADDADEGLGSENLRTAASAQTLAEFPLQSAARQEMASVYEALKEQKHLNLFGAVNVKQPLAAGSHTVPPPLLEEILKMPMSALTPKPTNTVFLAGIAVATIEALVSVTANIPLNLLAFATVAFVILDRLLVNGAILESFLKLLSPKTQEKIIKHEAGHFLAAYLLGCPVEGIVLSAWGALKDRRFGRTRQVSAGTSFFDPQLSEQINTSGNGGVAKVTRSSIDRYSIIVMAGIAAEADAYGRADGGAGDELALVAFLSQLNLAVGGTGRSLWNPESIRNQARWGALQAVLLLRHYRPAYEALVDALERGGSLGDCVYAIEKAARDHNLSPLQQPLGYLEDNLATGIVTWSNATSTENNSKDSTVSSTERQASPPPIMDEQSSLDVLNDIRFQMQEKIRGIEERLKEIES